MTISWSTNWSKSRVWTSGKFARFRNLDQPTTPNADLAASLAAAGADGAVDAAARRQNTAGLKLTGREAVLFSIGPGLLSSLSIGKNSNGTLLQDLWARAAKRAVFRQGPQNSCRQTLPEVAKGSN